jgi:hypothetical protein
MSHNSSHIGHANKNIKWPTYDYLCTYTGSNSLVASEKKIVKYYPQTYS